MHTEKEADSCTHHLPGPLAFSSGSAFTLGRLPGAGVRHSDQLTTGVTKTMGRRTVSPVVFFVLIDA
jgi:hypothetical protein